MAPLLGLSLIGFRSCWGWIGAVWSAWHTLGTLVSVSEAPIAWGQKFGKVTQNQNIQINTTTPSKTLPKRCSAERSTSRATACTPIESANALSACLTIEAECM